MNYNDEKKRNTSCLLVASLPDSEVSGDNLVIQRCTEGAEQPSLTSVDSETVHTPTIFICQPLGDISQIITVMLSSLHSNE